jgi:hypothetical protein
MRFWTAVGIFVLKIGVALRFGLYPYAVADPKTGYGEG